MFANAEGHKLPLESDGIWLNKTYPLINYQRGMFCPIQIRMTVPYRTGKSFTLQHAVYVKSNLEAIQHF